MKKSAVRRNNQIFPVKGFCPRQEIKKEIDAMNMNYIRVA
jgi:hypothetical protein